MTTIDIVTGDKNSPPPDPVVEPEILDTKQTPRSRKRSLRGAIIRNGTKSGGRSQQVKPAARENGFATADISESQSEPERLAEQTNGKIDILVAEFRQITLLFGKLSGIINDADRTSCSSELQERTRSLRNLIRNQQGPLGNRIQEVDPESEMDSMLEIIERMLVPSHLESSIGLDDVRAGDPATIATENVDEKSSRHQDLLFLRKDLERGQANINNKLASLVAATDRIATASVANARRIANVAEDLAIAARMQKWLVFGMLVTLAVAIGSWFV